jgi:hypothetical protein
MFFVNILFMLPIRFFAYTNVQTCQIIFSHEKIFCELLLKKEIQMCFPLNGVGFLIFIYHICVDL